MRQRQHGHWVCALANNTTGGNNIALGSNARSQFSTGNDNIHIGHIGFGQRLRDHTHRGTGNIRRRPLLLASCGATGSRRRNSSRRCRRPPRHDSLVTALQGRYQANGQRSEAILAFKPVTFQYRSDNKGTPQFGLIAEDVADVNPDLVVCDEKGEIYTVRYDAVNAMLLNEFLKEHRRVQEQTQRIQEQETTIAELKKQVQTVVAHAKEQDVKIQRVSDQVQASNSAAQVVVNGP